MGRPFWYRANAPTLYFMLCGKREQWGKEKRKRAGNFERALRNKTKRYETCFKQMENMRVGVLGSRDFAPKTHEFFQTET